MKRGLTPHQSALRRGDGSHWLTLKDIMPLLWPEGRMDLKIRVVLAIVALVLAKVVTVLTPFTYKYAVDALTAKGGVPALIVVPAFMGPMKPPPSRLRNRGSTGYCGVSEYI